MLAPIAGVTDRATRTIARELGCPLVFSELTSAAGLAQGDPGSLAMLDSCRDEHPLVIQLFGPDPVTVAEATRIVVDLGPDGVDLNLGCPAKRVLDQGAGMALTRDTKLLGETIAAMRRNTGLPLSVKVRAGWTDDELTFLDVARIAQEEGADALILHARTRAMGFSGRAHWPWITQLKSSVSIAVVGNGDVTDGESAAQILAETGCDGVMVGRASFGNPWIFRQIQYYLACGRVLPPPPLQARVETLIRHLKYAAADKGERRGVLETRKQVGWYLKGFPRVKRLRWIVNRLETADEMVNAIRTWADEQSGDPNTRADTRRGFHRPTAADSVSTMEKTPSR